MPRPSRLSPEVRERAGRIVVEQTPTHDSPWAAIRSIGEKMGCHSETLRTEVRDHERSVGHRPGPTAADQSRLKPREREHREVRRAAENLGMASA